MSEAVGLSADFALLRTSEPLESFDDLVGSIWRPLFKRHTHCSDGWLLAVASFCLDPYEVESSLLKEVVARTGSPALMGRVSDSDELHVAGYDGAEYWEAWLDPAMSARTRLLTMLHREAGAHGTLARFDDGWRAPHPPDWQQQLERSATEIRRAIPVNARAAARWAATAGREVRVEPIEQLLGRERGPFAEDLFTDLVGLLGIAGAALTADGP